MSPRLWQSLPFVFFLFTVTAFAQQTSPNDQALQYIQQTLRILTPNGSISSVTINGSVHEIAGADDLTGSFDAQADLAGNTQVQTSVETGTTVISVAATDYWPVGTLTDAEGKKTAIPAHNILTDQSWFYPTLILERLSTQQNFMATASVTDSGIQIYGARVFSARVKNPGPLVQLSTVQMTIDPKTFLPVSLAYNLHPDADSLVDFPVFVQYSDYREVNGQLLPFHITKYLNNVLQMDIQVSTVSSDSNIPASK